MKKNKVAIILAIVIGVFALIAVGFYWTLPKTTEIETKGNFEEKAVIEEGKKIIDLLNADNYQEIQENYADEKMKEVLMGDTIKEAKKGISPDWGEFVSYGNAYTAEVDQMGKSYAVLQLNAAYKNTGVLYTISFDENLKLAGLYMK